MNRKFSFKAKFTPIASAVLTAALASAATLATADNANADAASVAGGEQASAIAPDLLREGKIEGALLLNEHLNNFTIDVEVEGDRAVLSGQVDSDTESDLAEQIAYSVDGIKTVDNQLVVDDNQAEGEAAQSESALRDATITAKVKMGLLTNGNVSGTAIEVETNNSVVTLKGEVTSDAESDLAEKIAENVDDVAKVDNDLKIAGS